MASFVSDTLLSKPWKEAESDLESAREKWSTRMVIDEQGNDEPSKVDTGEEVKR